ncbi:hypothetical protein ACIGQC_30340 [Streptomyces albidoflavus]
MDVTAFPDDLVQTQAAWNTTYDALAVPRPRDTVALRRRLLFLSGHLDRPSPRRAMPPDEAGPIAVVAPLLGGRPLLAGSAL